MNTNYIASNFPRLCTPHRRRRIVPTAKRPSPTEDAFSTKPPATLPKALLTYRWRCSFYFRRAHQSCPARGTPARQPVCGPMTPRRARILTARTSLNYGLNPISRLLAFETLTTRRYFFLTPRPPSLVVRCNAHTARKSSLASQPPLALYLSSPQRLDPQFSTLRRHLARLSRATEPNERTRTHLCPLCTPSAPPRSTRRRYPLSPRIDVTRTSRAGSPSCARPRETRTKVRREPLSCVRSRAMTDDETRVSPPHSDAPETDRAEV